MKSTVKYHEDNPWLISESEFVDSGLGKFESIFSLGNGYMGTRAATEEAYVNEKRDTFVAGSFDRLNADEVTELPNVPDVFQLNIVIEGNRLDLNDGEISEYDRTLNLRTGELTRSFIWKRSEKRYQITTSRFVSLAQRHLMGQRVTIRPLDENAEIQISAGINGQMTNSGTQHFNDDVKRLYPNNVLQLTAKTNESHIDFVLTAQHRLNPGISDNDDTKTEMLRRQLRSTYTAVATVNQDFVFENLITIFTSRDNDITYRDSQSLRARGLSSIKEIEMLTYQDLLFESEKAWNAQVWDEMPIEIDSKDIRDQLAINFSRYHMQIMTPRHDERMNIGAKGLSGEGYKGHTFWDTELFMLPYFIFNNPETARKLVTYRYLGLEGARRKAAENGYLGAQYPWEAAWIEDGETTPVWGATDIVTGKATKIWSGFIEQHITADVAYGVQQYIQATQDYSFAETMGNEIILDTARFWASRLEWNEVLKRYEINDVIGPDEYKEHANNNAFTNYMARWNMQLANDLISNLKSQNISEYKRLNAKLDLSSLENELGEKIDKLYLPEPNKDLVIPENDDYLSKKILDLTPYTQSDRVGSLFNSYNLDQVNEMQITKQADVILLLFLFEKHYGENVKRANWAYYEPKTTHDSSLSLLTHTNFAADLGLNDLAYKLYCRARDIDMGPNMMSSDEGIHAASIAGIWSTTVLGFGGVRYLEGELRIQPNLPDNWKKLRFHIWWHGQKLEIIETHEATIVRNLTGTKAITIIHDDEMIDIPMNGDTKL